jgi:hypothetical protein
MFHIGSSRTASLVFIASLVVSCGGKTSTSSPPNNASAQAQAEPAKPFPPLSGNTLEEMCQDLCARIERCGATADLVPAGFKCDGACQDGLHEEEKYKGGPIPCAETAASCDALKACKSAPTSDAVGP